jgi:phosphoribosyl 1,2-cyclic phosphate phosphodiesterase
VTARSLAAVSYVFLRRYGYPTIVHLETLEHVKIHAGFAIDSVEMPHGPTASTGFASKRRKINRLCDGFQ